MKWERYAVALAALIFFWALGGHDLWAPNEPFFAEGAREMLTDGQWAVPHVNGAMTTHKPAFFFWLIALVSMPLGAVTPWTARLPSAIAALGTVLLTIRIGRQHYGPRTAAMAVVVLSTTLLFWDTARSAQIDATLCFFIWVALAAFVAWRSGDADGRRAGVLLWAATACAVLSKGPVGFAIVILIVLATLASDRQLGRLRDFAPVLGPAVFALIVGAWMVIATVGSHGEYSVWGALQEHVVSRGIHGMHHKQPFWYYAKVLPWALFPWSALAVGAAVYAWRGRRRDIDRFLLIAATVVVIFFSVSTEKRDLYVLSALPAVALLIGRLLAIDLGLPEGRVENGQRPAVDRRWISIAQGITGAILVAVGVAIPVAAQRLEEVSVHVALPLSLVLAATGTIVLVMAILGRASRSAIPLAAGMALAFILAASLVYPALEGRKSARSFALQLKEVTATSRAQGHEVVAFDLGNLPVAIAFYSDGVYTVETDDPGVLERHLMQDGRVFATINAMGLEMLSDEAMQRLVVLHRTRLSRRDVLLVSNHGG